MQSNPTEPNNTGVEKIEASDIVEVINKQYPRLFNGVDRNKQAQIVAAFSTSLNQVQIQKTHSGPLPDAETLEHYARIIPNGAERVMAMAEREQSFRHEYSNKVSKRQLNQISRGQWLGFIIACIGLVGGIFLSYNGKETSGLSTIIGSMVLLAGAFITGRIQNKKDTNN